MIARAWTRWTAAVAAAVALAAVMAGCGGGAGEASLSGADPAPSDGTARERGISLLIWESYVSRELLDRFEEITGAKVAVTEVENSERLMQELASSPGSFDVVVADEKTLAQLIDLRLLQELGSGLGGGEAWKFPHASISSGHAGSYSVPYLWGLTVLAGRHEVLSEAEASWSLIWREDLRVSLLDEPADLAWIALLALGRDPQAAGEKEVEEAVARLGARFPDFRGVMKDSISALAELESGALDLVVAYNGDAVARALANPGIRVVIPREGAPLWLDSFAVSRDSPDPELARRFIAFMSSKESAALSANELLYATPHPEALAMVDPAFRADPALYPPADLLARCGLIDFGPDLERHLNRLLVGLLRGERGRDDVPDVGQAGLGGLPLSRPIR